MARLFIACVDSVAASMHVLDQLDRVRQLSTVYEHRNVLCIGALLYVLIMFKGLFLLREMKRHEELSEQEK